jgi:hypothetical protein
MNWSRRPHPLKVPLNSARRRASLGKRSREGTEWIFYNGFSMITTCVKLRRIPQVCLLHGPAVNLRPPRPRALTCLLTTVYYSARTGNPISTCVRTADALEQMPGGNTKYSVLNMVWHNTGINIVCCERCSKIYMKYIHKKIIYIKSRML